MNGAVVAVGVAGIIFSSSIYSSGKKKIKSGLDIFNNELSGDLPKPDTWSVSLAQTNTGIGILFDF